MKIMSVIHMEDVDVNETHDKNFKDPADIHFTIASCCIFMVCVFGMLGNGLAFWFLFFRIPRNKFTVYIINLIIADFAYLFFNAILMILQIDQLIGLHPNAPGMIHVIISLEVLYDGAYQAGMFFLLAISIERCLSVFFPIWYRCCRPKHQSSIVCTGLWCSALLESCLENLVCTAQAFAAGSVQCTGVQAMTFVLAIGISLPVMVFSSTILLIKVHKTSIKCHPPKLYVIIIISVFVFLVACVPIKFMWLLMYLKCLPNNFQSVHFFFASILCTVFSSSINPYIYFMIGRQKKHTMKSSIHSALHHVFHVEEDETEKSFGNSSGISHISL
ncbi:proto-oncogene Mas-like [Hyperolius riggenbachi]|uniref:proto-oncogene Mas-like n=1 Tax=Hyperolius riggenbachi TaxID=752182 RepID=UPI0035A35977